MAAGFLERKWSQRKQSKSHNVCYNLSTYEVTHNCVYRILLVPFYTEQAQWESGIIRDQSEGWFHCRNSLDVWIKEENIFRPHPKALNNQRPKEKPFILRQSWLQKYAYALIRITNMCYSFTPNRRIFSLFRNTNLEQVRGSWEVRARWVTADLSWESEL